jgi:3-oxoacyl-(acyl-carrier-protein) synthase
MRDVWITGVGAVTGAGLGAAALDDLLVTGRSAVKAGGGPDEPAARSPTPPRTPATRRLDRSGLLFFTAGAEAWADAGLRAGTWRRDRAIVIEGSSVGPMGEMLEAVGGPRWPSPAGLIRFMIGAGGATLAQTLGIEGGALHLSAASVSAACAIGEGYLKIAAGLADLALVGGSECPLHPAIIAGFRAAGVLAPADRRLPACRPFDTERCGTVLGEGSGALVLEAPEHAIRRGAGPRAVLGGYGLSGESFGMTSPDPSGRGVRRAAGQALGGLSADRLGWIKTHGTGTELNDAAECRGLAALLGDAIRRVPLTSLKPALGHCLGASTAVETVAVVLAMQHGLIPPTLGTTSVDPALPPCYIALQRAEPAAPHVLVLAESFGGRCAALLLQAATLADHGDRFGLQRTETGSRSITTRMSPARVSRRAP